MTDHNSLPPAGISTRPRRKATWLKVIVPVVILAVGINVALYLRNSGARPKKKTPAKLAMLVQVVPLKKISTRVKVRAMGTVMPARQVVLKSRVTGQVLSVHPDLVPGGFLPEGAEALRIDPVDYQLDLADKQSRVAEARYALKLEMGHQDVARREWEILNNGQPAVGVDAELALRKPHLLKAQASLAAARADLKQAELRLARTHVKVPFNAIVRSKQVEVGSQVAVQDQLADLVGTDTYWVQVTLPIDRLKWVAIPGRRGKSGAPARIVYGNGQFERSGLVFKLLGDLETQGRLARLMVAVDDPLDLKRAANDRPPLLIGEYVHVTLEGRRLKDVFAIPRTALRDNARVWLAGEGGKLEIRPVTPLWRDSEVVLIRDHLTSGDQLIVSDLAAPIDGMAIRVANSPSADTAAELGERHRTGS